MYTAGRPTALATPTPTQGVYDNWMRSGTWPVAVSVPTELSVGGGVMVNYACDYQIHEVQVVTPTNNPTGDTQLTQQTTSMMVLDAFNRWK